VTSCTKCRQENPDEASFCLACGAALRPAEPERARAEVRKTVTVLFSDLTGSTALGERLDAEAMRLVIARYFEEMNAILERHGGTVEKFIGDAIMAVFGIPTLHEDDSVRAVRAGVEMRDSLVHLNAKLEPELDVQLETRTGIATGEIVTGAGHTLATGDAVNLAARLEQAAAPGEILLAAETYQLVRDAVRAEPLAPLALKGKAARVEAYRLHEVLPGTDPFARRLEAPLVGRTDELAHLLAAYRHAVEETRVSLVTVLGPAGIGKSRLTRALLATIGGQARVVVGRCLPYGDGVTYRPLQDVVKQVERDGPEAADVSRLLQNGGVSEEIFWAARKLFEALARERPLIAVFDDVQWAEPTFLDFIEYLVAFGGDAPILLLCISRPELLEVRPSWATPRANASSLLLEPLPDDTAEELLERMPGATRLPVAVRARILKVAEGNPLYVEQMLALRASDGAPTDEPNVPPTIQALLAARIDRLEPRERAVLARAAVEGRFFRRGTVSELSPLEDHHALSATLMSLVRKQFIEPDRSSFAGEDAFRFAHILIRDAAYRSLPKEARAELHERFADGMEAKSETQVDGAEEILGYHLERACRYRTALGVSDGHTRRLARRAGEALDRAGRRAIARGDWRGATKLFERALGVHAAPDAIRAELLLDLAGAQSYLGEYEQAQDLVKQASETAAATGDERMKAHSRLLRLAYSIQTDPTSAALRDIRRQAEQLMSRFEVFSDELGLSRCWRIIGNTSLGFGHADEAEQAFERSLSHARRAGDRRLELAALDSLTEIAFYGPRPVEDALQRCETLVAELEETPHRQIIALMHMAGLRAMLGEFEQARQLFDRVRKSLRELGLPPDLGPDGSDVELLAGDPASAERELRASYAHAERTGNRFAMPLLTASLAEALYRQGRFQEAERFAEISESTSVTGDIWMDPWRAVKAKLLARGGEFDRAEALAREAVAMMTETDVLNAHGDVLMSLGEVFQLSGKCGQAVDAATAALRLYEQKGNLVSAANARTFLDELAAEPLAERS
jgi:class 3 adenylate cyclase/tetratricopeptide (TPR) repeat protein